MIHTDLYKLNDKGMLIEISKTIYDDSKHLLKKLSEFENGKLKSATQLVKDVSEEDLVTLVRKQHDEGIFKQFEEKFNIIRGYQDAGDYVLLLREDKGDFSYSNAIVVLHGSVTKSKSIKLFSCLFHSVNYEARPSYFNVIVGLAATTGLFIWAGPFYSFGGIIGTSYFARVTIPPEIKTALDIHMAKMLIEAGHVVEVGDRYILNPSFENKD